MTQERFFRILENPELLSGITYEELKTLALAYPYAHNLRYLLALKARQTGHPEADRTLATAAAYSLDRRQLFHILAPVHLTPQSVSLQKEEVLELKPLEVVQRELEALAPVLREERPESTVATFKITPPVEVAPAFIPPEPIEIDLEEAVVLSAPVVTTSPVPPAPPAVPLSFDHWLHQFQSPALVAAPPAPRKTDAVKLPTKDPVSPSIAHVLAERSVSENKDVISETLARLYAKQGHREKAIAMYERLCLAIPEKSTSFAAEIAKLKN